MKSLRIVFMGTPEFAVATLGSLLMNGFNVVGVVTAPDKPAGRGRKITKSAVKEFAEFSYLPIIQPDHLKDPAFINTLKKLKADVFIVVAFRMLPEVVWRLPSIGTINLHASLLPHYRGAAPINHAIINGETETGITTFLIDDKIDTGNVLLREKVQICAFENAGDLHDRLMRQGAKLVIRTLEGLAKNNIRPQNQSKFIKSGEVLKTAPKILPEHCIVNWKRDPETIHNLIRGLSPYPCARTFIRRGSEVLSLKIYESEPEEVNHKYKPGHLVSDGKHCLKIACSKGFLNIITLQLEGRNRMNAVEFLRGFRIANYSVQVS
ncbi:MAG: methionyl-tRNA formyltransferase [Bacteroidota bacterium]